METYTDTDNDSNVKNYEIGSDFIIVEFKSGAETFYKYTEKKSGEEHVNKMKELAKCGDGLNAYIINNKVDYDSKW